ncbi:MAG: DUF373 family protein [Candidatus Bathyarchaeia archaeon]|nr:DUF373 family protein [Candidatus Bathyarchaeota archaeon]
MREMPAEGTRELGEERILILCVDRDNDIGRKAGVKTPIIGGKENIDAAIKLLLADPEEADANAMFEAVRIYESLKSGASGNILCQVATITGSELGGVAADRKLTSELNEVIREFNPTSLILVTDGYSDEEILPLIQSRVPISSIRRVIVRHSKSIEETAAIFSRYLKRILEDPRYSKIILGLPGILLVMLGILSLIAIFVRYDIGRWAWTIGLLIVGFYLLGKGYGIDKKIVSILPILFSSYGLIIGFSMLSGLLLISVGLYQSISQIISSTEISTKPIAEIAGIVISASLPTVISGLSIILFGRILAHLLTRDYRFWRTIVLMVACIWSWKIFDEAAKILIDPTLPLNGLWLSIVIGITIVAVLIPVVRFLGKKYREFFNVRD